MKKTKKRIIQFLLCSMVAEDSFILSKVDLETVLEKILLRVQKLPILLKISFTLALLLFEYAIPPLAWKFRRFSNLTLEKRMRYIEHWEKNKIARKRMLFKLLKAVCLPLLLSQKELLNAIGYHSALHEREGVSSCSVRLSKGYDS